MRKLSLFFLIIIALILTGCATKATDELGSSFLRQPLSNETMVGQTFLARHDGLESIDIFLYPTESQNSTLILSLFELSKSSQEIRQSAIPIRSINHPGFYRFSFPPIQNSFGKTYYLRLSMLGKGTVDVASMDPFTYLDGGMYTNGIPNDRQLVFKLNFQLVTQLIGIIKQFLQWVLESGLVSLLLILPGLCLLLLFSNYLPSLSLGEYLGLSTGLSAALFPTMYAIAFYLGISPGRWLTLAILVISTAIVVYRLILFYKYKKTSFQHYFINKNWRPDLVLLVIIVIISFTRFWAIRTMQAPIGLDPIHHTAIVQLILRNNGLFQSWLPYAPYQTFSTHFGFHILAASYLWISHAKILHGILVVAQTINVFSVVSIFPLVLRFSNHNRWSGVGAVLAIGLLSPMPAYFINWGRYPQLVGSLILPIVCWFSLDILETRKAHHVIIFLGGLTLAGLMYAYYRAPYYYIAFIIGCFVVLFFTRLKFNFHKWLQILIPLLVKGIVAILLFLPWTPYLLAGRLSTEDVHGTLNSIEQVLADYQAWKGLMSYVSIPLIIGACGGLLTGLFSQKYEILILPLWILTLSSLVAAALLKIPGLGLMQNNAVLMTIYIPLGILFGCFFSDVETWLKKNKSFYFPFAILVALSCAFGILSVARIASPNEHTFITTPDLRAMEWIRENTQADSRFFSLVQRFKQTSAIAVDAGWWIPILTERPNNLPPQYALVMEKPIQNDYSQKVIQWAFDLETFPLYSSRGIKLLCENGFDYVYIGQYGRLLSNAAQEMYLDTKRYISNSPAFTIVYQEDQVRILKLNQEACRGFP